MFIYSQLLPTLQYKKGYSLHGFHTISTFHLAVQPAYINIMCKVVVLLHRTTANLVPRISSLQVVPLLCWIGLSRNVYHNTDDYLSHVYSLQLNRHVVRICRHANISERVAQTCHSWFTKSPVFFMVQGFWIYQTSLTSPTSWVK